LPAVRIRPTARSASTAPRRSPSISDSIIAVAETPVMLLATEPSLMPADSSALPSRWISEVRACTVFILYAESRIMPMTGRVAWVPMVAGAESSA
jgi:hypothetical protein